MVGLVVGGRTRESAERSLDELSRLAEAAGATPILRVMQERRSPNPATFLGAGKVESLRVACDETGANLVVVDNELSPAQLRNLEEGLDRRVVDRTQLILDIFARRARTREGKLQVELAQLRYLLPRLVGAATALSRLGGGIGTRGPGETKLETDRRRIRRRIGALADAIELVRRRRAQLRDRRQRASVPTVALVGYTNAGKSTLFNRLTGQQAQVSDALFVTLDPLVRQVTLPDQRQILLSDTVGFIDRLPHALVAAFRATLEEVAEADLLLHVIDGSSEDRELHADAVRRVLVDVEAADVPMLTVFNKCDLVGDGERHRFDRHDGETLAVSAHTGDGVEALRRAILSRLSLETCRVAVDLDATSAADQDRVRGLYRHARVLQHEHIGGRVTITADVPRRLIARLRLVESAHEVR